MKKLAIDRFEEQWAILEDDEGRLTRVERSRLPDGARQGDVLSAEGDAYTVDAEETAARRARIRRLEQTLRAEKRP